MGRTISVFHNSSNGEPFLVFPDGIYRKLPEFEDFPAYEMIIPRDIFIKAHNEFIRGGNDGRTTEV